MMRWSPSVALCNAVAFVFAALLLQSPVPNAVGLALSGGNDDVEAVLVPIYMGLCFLACVLMGWRRPRGFGGAAIGASATVAAFQRGMAAASPLQSAAITLAIVLLGELVGVVSHALLVPLLRRRVN